VFVSRLGKAMTPRSIQLLLDRYATPLGMSISPHCLRHTFALDSLARGNKLTAVQAILGHQSVTTTLSYDRASPDDLSRAVEREIE
jgi:site-specific recombinase XerD